MTVATLSSTSFTRTSLSIAAESGGAAARDPVAAAEAEARDGQKLLKKLDKALDRLRDDDDRPGRRRGADEGRKVGYDRNGLLPGIAGLAGGKPEGALSAETASLSRTELTVDENGINYAKAELSVGHLETDRGTLDVVSLKVTRAYIGFGGETTTGGVTA